MEKMINTVVVWGCGNGCKEMLEKYPVNLEDVVAFVDADRNKTGEDFYGHKIICPDDLGQIEFDCIVISIKNQENVKQIRNQYPYQFITIEQFVHQKMIQLSCFFGLHAEGDIEERYLEVLHENMKSRGLYPVAIPDSINFFNRYKEYVNMKGLYTARNAVNKLKDYSRLHSMMLNLHRILEGGVEGVFAELGVYLGNNCAVLHEYCKKYNRKLYMFDTFEGFDARDLTGIDKDQMMQFKDTTIDGVRAFVGDDEYTKYIKGYFPESVTSECREEKYAFVSLDCDLYQPLKAGLEFFYPRMSKGGMIFIHDYSGCFFEGARMAVDEYCNENHLSVVLLPDKAGTAVLVK